MARADAPTLPDPAGARRPRAADRRGAGPGHRVQRAGLADHARPAAPSSPGQEVELVDPEGLPLARLSPRRRGRAAHPRPARPVPPAPPDAGPGPRAARRRHVRPGRRRARPRTSSSASASLGHPVVLLALTGPGTPELSPVALLRASLAAAAHGCPDAAVVAVPLASHGDPEVDHDLGVQVVGGVRRPRPGARPWATATATTPTTSPRSSTPTGRRPERQGLVLFFTGLSGSGKSTVAQAVIDPLLERGRAHGHQPRRRRRTPEPLGRPDLQPGGPRDQHPPDRLGRRRDLAARRRRGVQPDRAVRRDPPGRPRDDRRRRRRVLPGPRRHPARGVRAPRPQGSLRQGPPRRDPRVHRHLLALRGAARRRPPHRHHRPHDRGLPRRGARRARPRPASSPRPSVEPDRGRPTSTSGADADPRALRLYGEHLPLAVPRAPRAPAARPRRGRRGEQCRHPRLRRVAGQRHDGGGVRAVGHRRRRRSAAGPRPASWSTRPTWSSPPRPPTAPGCSRSGPAAFRKIFTLGQFVASARGGRPRRSAAATLLAALENRRVPAAPRPRHRRPLPAWPRRRRAARPPPWRRCSRCSWRSFEQTRRA